MSGAASDKTVNKVALCSAIFAGVAYVGYSVARVAFSRTLMPKDEQNHRRINKFEKFTQRNIHDFYEADGDTSDDSAIARSTANEGRRKLVYLRRLSGSEQTILGENFHFRGGGITLRPLSVQERIRELNSRARHFAESVLAIQVQDESRRALLHSRSLQPSPTHTRKVFNCASAAATAENQSSVDKNSNPQSSNNSFIPPHISDLGYANSVENFGDLDYLSSDFDEAQIRSSNLAYCTATLPSSLKQRWSRRSARLKKNLSKISLIENSHNGNHIEAEAQRLLDEREAELRKRLKGFEDGSTKILTPYECKSLIALLHSKDLEVLEKALITVSNSAAFSANQDLLREEGGLVRLQQLLKHPNSRVQRAALTAVGNMALNVSNQKVMDATVPALLPLIEQSVHAHGGMASSVEVQEFIHQSLLTLTNVAALTDWHLQFRESLSTLLDLTQTNNPKIRMQSLRLLVNLSTNEEMVPHLLASKAPEYVWNMLDGNQPEDQLLRVVTLLANLVCSDLQRRRVSGFQSTSLDNNPDPKSMHSALFGLDNREDVIGHLSYLMQVHPHEDIRVKARMIHTVLIEREKRISN